MDRPSLQPYEDKLTQLMEWAAKSLPSYADRIPRPKLGWMEK